MLKSRLSRCCPICNNCEGEKLYTLNFGEYDKKILPNSYDLVFCDHCGFIFADSIAAESDYDKYYEVDSKYQDDNVSFGGIAFEWEQLRWEFIIDKIKKIGIKVDEEIIDIGCAQGGSLVNLHQAGFIKLSGMDLCRSCIDKINEKGFFGYYGSVQSLDKPIGKKFKLIMLSHVLEHIYNLRRTIYNLDYLLDDDGIVYIELPDSTRYKEYFTVPFHFYDQEHINHFTILSLTNLMTMHGYELVTSGQKENRASESNMAPAFYGFFKKKNEKHIIDRQIIPDNEALSYHKEYIQHSEQKSNWTLLEYYAKK